MRHRSLAEERPDLLLQWSSCNEVDPLCISACSHRKVLWLCDKGHQWKASVKNRVLTNSSCPYCSHRAVLSGFNDLETMFPDIAKEWSDKNYPLLPSNVMAFSNKKAWWRCEKGHEWFALISSRSGGHGCPYCCGHLKPQNINEDYHH